MALRETADQIFPELARNQRTFLLAGGVGAVLSVVGYVTNQEQFFSSYLMAYMLVLGLTLGALGFAMVHQLSGGAWGVVSRQTLGAASRVLPFVTLLFIPIIVGMPHLYEWTHADVVANDEILKGKQAYLNPTFFMIRAVIYFVSWNALALFLNRWSKEQDETGNPALSLRMQRASAAGLLIYILTMSFASFDWIMSQGPTLVLDDLRGADRCRPGARGARVPDHHPDVARAPQADERGALLHLSERPGRPDVRRGGALGLHVVLAVPDHLVRRSAGRDHVVLHRMNNGWTALAITLVIVHFALPFFLLLMRGIKQNRRLISRVAMFIIFARVVDLFWLIAPETHTDGLVISWMDVVVPVAMLALWVGVFLQQLRQRPLLPVHDPQFEDILGPVFAHGEQPGTAH